MSTVEITLTDALTNAMSITGVIGVALVDRSAANLAMARRQLQEIENSLVI